MQHRDRNPEEIFHFFLFFSPLVCICVVEEMEGKQLFLEAMKRWGEKKIHSYI